MLTAWGMMPRMMSGFRGSYLGWLMPVIWIGVIILGIYLVKQVIDSNHSSDHQSGKEAKTPLEIARERYAKGEITQEEFQEIKEEFTD